MRNVHLMSRYSVHVAVHDQFVHGQFDPVV